MDSGKKTGSGPDNRKKKDKLTMYTSIKQAVEAIGEVRALAYINSKLDQLEKNKAKSRENREIVRAFKSGELNYGGSRVDLTTETK
jgi:hypothetical protein